MLLIRNDSVLTTPVAFTTAATKIPFDTVVYNTNDNLKMDSNSVDVFASGMYDTICQVIVANTSSSAAATVTLQAYADDKEITGATATATVAASGSATISLPWANKIIPASNGTAKLSWYLSGGAVNLTNAIAKVEKIV